MCVLLKILKFQSFISQSHEELHPWYFAHSKYYLVLAFGKLSPPTPGKKKVMTFWSCGAPLWHTHFRGRHTSPPKIQIIITLWIVELYRWNFTESKSPLGLALCKISCIVLKYFQSYDTLKFSGWGALREIVQWISMLKISNCHNSAMRWALSLILYTKQVLISTT